MAGPGYAGQYSSYAPSPQASGNLLVGYSRNADDFPVNKYIQIFPTSKMLGEYWEWTSRNAARIISPVSADHTWADGDACPPGIGNLESWQLKAYKTQRYAYTFSIGEMTYDQADIDLLLANSRDMAQQCMTARTMLVQNALQGGSWGSNTAAVNGTILGAGQNWANGTSNTPNVLQSIQYAQAQINLATIGVVRPQDLTLVINPNLAQTIARSQELRDYLKQSPFAMQQIELNRRTSAGQWGLPDTLYGVNIVVEDAVRVTTKKNTANTATTAYVMPDSIGFLLCRQGVLAGIQGSRSFSTVQLFFYKDEMTVETRFDADHKRYLGRVISNYVPVLASAYSGFQFTACK